MLARWTLPPATADDESNQTSLDDLDLSAFASLTSFQAPRRAQSKLETWKGRKSSTDSNSSSGDNQRDDAIWTRSPEEPAGSRDLAVAPTLRALAPSFVPPEAQVASRPLQASYSASTAPLSYTPTYYHHHDLPTQAYAVPSSMHCVIYYEVEFKRGRRSIFVGYAHFALGEYVKVEADRGYDVGVVVCAGETLDHLWANQAIMQSTSLLEPQHLSMPPKRILRGVVATELDQLALKEAVVLDVCRAKVRQRFLPMVVLDAEFQFDRHKLTFFFQAQRRIDFRELVRDLFGVYKTRIWLQQVG
ncbi:hypothetical protein SPRG_07812 [Saprolegnia parasitica CBS 223.65]|uniref:PSP1 C-terminal domain-containing protein n=1 Tax=Saprolegnia parasitica (strain CBS 223.65) TaxID=695850 RepID=A0A067CD43_SAPPC|nr:hypothetical protein SPRG_07812 [Saprolegnia parasitica CBS 223.65]KDO27100.1 hypothetical protein SPRG_07812 [Saprolegnia parasitica CBS 223.65]|eukprot:XP_012202194.1 hypothetical protein SPRG_07812 [Saprolegnia parasitica CBS 223.65]